MDRNYYISEIFPTKKFASADEWGALLFELSRVNGFLGDWQIVVSVIKQRIHYYLKAPFVISATINNLSSFIFKSVSLPELPAARSGFRPFTHRDNLAGLAYYAHIHGYGELQYIVIDFRALFGGNYYSKTHFYFFKNSLFYLHQSFAQSPAELLAFDFAASKNYIYKSPPEYTETSKILEHLHDDQRFAIFSIDTFPYVMDQNFLKLSDYDFAKHSLVLGSSGSGKSKFLSSFICNLYRDPSFCSKYKIVVIDPHDSMKEDIGVLGKVIDFLKPESSINLFSDTGQDVNSSSELMLDLFKTLLMDQYNSKLERVLRHSVYLLLVGKILNYPNLRKLLTDLEYRNLLIKKLTPNLPFSIVDFFLSDFNDLRTKSYSEAISPIIAFLDEMEMVPAFSQTSFDENLAGAINQNFLTLFSLDRARLGTKVTRTISGLVMEQLLTFVEGVNQQQHIIFIVDEVAVIENPILARLLSEARKYNLSLFLVGQFLNQFSEELKNSIFANVTNYYMFRLSQLEAKLLADNLNLKIPTNNTKEHKVEFLSRLNDRECVVRISIGGKLFPAFKASVLDFVPIKGG